MARDQEQPDDERGRTDLAPQARLDFAARLRKMRVRSRLTLRLLAKKSGYSTGALSEKLNGKRPIDEPFLEAVLTVLYRATNRDFEPDREQWLADLHEVRRQEENNQGLSVAGKEPRRATPFQSRDEVQTVQALLTGGVTVVISGLNGVGKTQVAVGVVRAVRRDGAADVTIWVHAASRAELIAGLAEAARALGVSSEADAVTMANRLLVWLDGPTGPRWLVVFDDLAGPAEASEFWPPASQRGNTIVTTNWRDATLHGEGRRFVPMEPFTVEQSWCYLRDRLGLEPADRKVAEALAAGLGHVPMALAQAAAYMENLDLDCRSYLDRLRESALAAVAPKPLPDDQRIPTDQLWALSIDRADELSPPGLARLVLELIAQLDSDNLPIEVLTSAVAIGYLGQRCGHHPSSRDIEDALHSLQRLSLLEVDGRRTRISVNRMLQRSVRESMSTVHRDDALVAAADSLLSVWPGTGRNIEMERVLRANALALVRRAGAGLWRAGVHELVFQAGKSLRIDGLRVESVRFWERMRSVATEQLGATHVDTLILWNNLAWAYGDAGMPQRAVGELRELFAVRAGEFGPDDDNTMATRHGLAIWLDASGNVDEAMPMMEAVHADYLREQGPGARDTLNARLSLVLWHGDSDGADATVTRLQELAGVCGAELGPDKEETLDVRYHLADWLGRANRYADALQAADQLCRDSDRVLGPQHPDTHLARRLSGSLLVDAGQRSQGVDALRRLHNELLRIYGAGHLYTRTIAEQLRELSEDWPRSA